MDLLREIITMDKSAAARVETAVYKQKQRTDEFGENSAKQREKMLSEERAENASYKEEQEKLLSEKKKSSDEALKSRTAALDKRFEENGERWRAEIIKRITEE